MHSWPSVCIRVQARCNAVLLTIDKPLCSDGRCDEGYEIDEGHEGHEGQEEGQGRDLEAELQIEVEGQTLRLAICSRRTGGDRSAQLIAPFIGIH